jgi:aryl-alcohol dehydrogenase-like predicted oxidoreductase
MRYRRLGTSDMEVSVVSFGCWAMGGLGWGDVDDRDSIAAVHRAMDLGINLFDTADVYGRGHSEEVLGRALKGRRDRVFVATKVGNRWDDSGNLRADLSRDYILKAVDDSLRRLDIDIIDLYQTHRPDPNTPVQETMDTLLELVERGKVRYIGTSNLTVEELREYQSYGKIVSIQPVLNLFVRYIEAKLLPHCQRTAVGVIVYSPMAMGLLTAKYDRPVTFPPDDFRANNFLFLGKTFERNIAIAKALDAYARERGHTAAQLAVAWVIAHANVTSAICGAKRPSQIEETAPAGDWDLSEQELREIDEIMVGTQS